MLETRALVLSSQSGLAIVSAEHKSGCGHCDSTRGCGKSNLSQLFCSNPRTFEVIDPLGTSPGDNVLIGVREGALLQGALLVYLLPLLALFAGAFAGSLWHGETGSIIGALIGGAAAFLAVRRYSRTHLESRRFRPYIISRVGRS